LPSSGIAWPVVTGNASARPGSRTAHRPEKAGRRHGTTTWHMARSHPARPLRTLRGPADYKSARFMPLPDLARSRYRAPRNLPT
jgi:hypothetical protein